MKPHPPTSAPAPEVAPDAVHPSDLLRLVDASDQAILIVDGKGMVLLANTRAQTWFPESAPLAGKPSPVPWTVADTTPVRVRGLGDTVLHLRRTVTPSTWAGAPAHIITLTDDTSLRLAEEHLRRLGRLHAALAQTASAITRATNEVELLEDACRIAVALAGFRSVWIGRVNPAHTEVRRIAAAGIPVIPSGSLTLDPDGPTGQGPVAQTLRLGVPYICNLVAADSRLSFWETEARRYEIASLAVCPLRSGGTVHAIMAFYAREPGCFDSELVTIISQIVADVGVGLERLNGRDERRRVESALAESEARFRLIARASRHVLWMRDAGDGRLLYVSPAFAKVFGCEPEAFLESSEAWLTLVHADDRARVAAALPPASVVGQPTTLHYRIMRPDGDLRWIEDEIIPIEEHGRVRFLSGSAADVTRRHEAERQVSVFRSLVDAAGDVFYILRPADDFRLIYINDAGVRHFGWSREELLTMRPWDWDPNFTRENTQALWTMLQSRGSTLFETTTRRRDGTLVRVETVSNLLRHEDEELNVGYFRDISARSRAETELRDSEERFRAVFEEASDALLLSDPVDYRFVDCNASAVRLFDAGNKAALFGRQSPDLYVRVPQPAEIERIRRQIVDTGSWSGLVEFRSLQGRRFWGAVATRRIHVGGRPLHIIRITDTTENRRLVELLADTERLARIGGWEYHLEDDRLVWTNGTYLIHGIDPGTHITLAEAFARHDPPFRAAIEAAAQKGIGSGEPWTIDSRINRNGVEVWIRVHGTTEFVEERPRRIHGTIEDITETHRTTAALRERDEQVREQAMLIDEATDAIILCDRLGYVRVWNRGAESLLGWTRQEAVGRRSEDLHFPDRERFGQALVAAQGQGMWNGELEYRTRTGACVLVESRWTLILDPAGQPRTILTINTDITERRRREAGLLRAQRLESIGTLAGGIAHDLNNILAPVVLSSDMLRMRIKDPMDLELIDAIGTSARRGAEVVRQVLSFARGVEGTHVPLNIRHLLPEIRHIITETFPRNITNRIESPTDLWSIMAEPTQIHQVLLNLCLNARDAMPDGGTLTLRGANVEVDSTLAAMVPGAHAGPHVRVQVADTGSGVAKEVRDRIFEPFFTTKGPGRGSGLGLSTAMAIARSHKGFITLETEIGRGTTMSLHLPAEHPATTEATPQPPAAHIAGHGEMILVVDDEASVRSITRQSLEGAGYRVLAAEDGATAITEFLKNRDQVALVITDLMMPVMDGVAVIRTLQRIAPAVHIIAMSGATDAADLAHNLTPSPSVGFLLKPFNLDSLLRAVREAIGGPPVL